MNDADFRIIERTAKAKDDRIRKKPWKVGADFTSRQTPLVDATLWARTIDRRNRDARVGEHGGILPADHKTEIAFGIRISLGPNNTIAHAFDDDVHRRCGAVTEANASAQINRPRNFWDLLLYPAVGKRGLVSRLPPGTSALLSTAGLLRWRRRLLAALFLAEAQRRKGKRHGRNRDRSNALHPNHETPPSAVFIQRFVSRKSPRWRS